MEAALDHREDEQARVVAEIEAELDAQAHCQAEAARHEEETMALYSERVAAGEQPF